MLDTVLMAGGAAGTAVLGFVAGIVRQQSSREARLEERIDKEMSLLRVEVEKCRHRDKQMVKVSVAMKMLIPELQRLDRGNPVLKIIADALRDVPNDAGEFEHLLNELDNVPGAYEFKAEKDDGADQVHP